MREKKKVENLANSQKYKTKYDIDFEKTVKFFELFAENMLIFDPLDRPVSIDGDEVTSIAQSDLKQKIRNLKKIQTAKTEIRAPLSTENYGKLDKLFSNEMKKCFKIEFEYQKNAKANAMQDVADKF